MMSKKVLTMVLLIAVGIFLLGIPAPNAVDTVRLQDGTLVILKVQETIMPEGLGPGDIVKLEVAEDIVVDNKVVIKKGAPAVAEVLSAEKHGMIGKGGKIALTLRSTTAVDGQKVPLRGTIRREGEEKMGTAIGVGAFICPLALLMKGESASIPSGSEVKGFVDNTMEIKANK